MVDELQSAELRRAELRSVYLKAASIKHQLVLASHATKVTEKKILTETLVDNFRGLQAKLVKSSKKSSSPASLLTVRADVEKLASIGKKVTTERASLVSLEEQQVALLQHKLVLDKRSEKTSTDIHTIKLVERDKAEAANLDEVLESKAARLGRVDESEIQEEIVGAAASPLQDKRSGVITPSTTSNPFELAKDQLVESKEMPRPEPAAEPKVISLTTAFVSKRGKPLLIELTKQEGQAVEVVLRADQAKDFNLLKGERESLQEELHRRGLGIGEIRVERVIRG